MTGNEKRTKKVVEAKVEPIKVESPLKGGLTETTKGVIIGALITALIATMVILLVLAEKEDTSKKYSSNNGSKNEASTNLVKPEDYSDAMKEFYKYFESEEKTVIVFASSQCGYCVAQKPIVEAITEKYDINYFLVK